jgi:hypothetical protein
VSDASLLLFDWRLFSSGRRLVWKGRTRSWGSEVQCSAVGDIRIAQVSERRVQLRAVGSNGAR